jgi:four helix bundle protein
MTYDRFEDLPVWQMAADMAVKVFRWTSGTWFRGKGDLANQLQRATLSISNNIAEGFERGTKNELLQFLYISRGSAGEVRSMLGVIERMTHSERTDNAVDSDATIRDLKSQCEQISRQIRGWANSLQNSRIEGQRHLNDESRQAYSQQQRRAAFQKQLDAANEASRKRREAERPAPATDEKRPEE